jgi:hypothetical protein
MPRQSAHVREVEPLIEGGHLRVRLTVCRNDGRQDFAFLPDREVSTLLPRSILLASLREVPQELLHTIEPMLKRQITGRAVRLWQYEERWYASFLPWRSVRFADP